jgi:hypothetical protein
MRHRIQAGSSNQRVKFFSPQEMIFFAISMIGWTGIFDHAASYRRTGGRPCEGF